MEDLEGNMVKVHCMKFLKINKNTTINKLSNRKHKAHLTFVPIVCKRQVCRGYL